MPKIIPELRERLLLAARKRLTEEESHDFSTRQLAADCGVAVGTVFNYFPNKEALLACMMLEDWQSSLDRMMEAAGSARTPELGFAELEALLREFSRPFLSIWQGYNHRVPRPEYHKLLIAQLSVPVQTLLQRSGAKCGETELSVLSELLLAASQREQGTIEKLIPIMKKIIA